MIMQWQNSYAATGETNLRNDCTISTVLHALCLNRKTFPITVVCRFTCCQPDQGSHNVLYGRCHAIHENRIGLDDSYKSCPHPTSQVKRMSLHSQQEQGQLKTMPS